MSAHDDNFVLLGNFDSLFGEEGHTVIIT